MTPGWGGPSRGNQPRLWWRAALRFWLPIALLVVVIYGGLPRNDNKAWQLLIAYYLGWVGSKAWAQRQTTEQWDKEWPDRIRELTTPKPPDA